MNRGKSKSNIEASLIIDGKNFEDRREIAN